MALDQAEHQYWKQRAANSDGSLVCLSSVAGTGCDESFSIVVKLMSCRVRVTTHRSATKMLMSSGAFWQRGEKKQWLYSGRSPVVD